MCSGRSQCCGSNEMVCKRVEVFCPVILSVHELGVSLRGCAVCGVPIVVAAFAVHIRVYHRHHDCCLQSGIWIVAVVRALARAHIGPSQNRVI